MDSTWWRSKDDLDEKQLEFIMLPPEGRLQLEGPPGSGKTNLLLLRAQFIAAQGDHNILILTYTKGLADFMRRGLVEKDIVPGDRVKTFHGWLRGHILQHLKKQLVDDEGGFSDVVRLEGVQLLKEANARLPTQKPFQAVFIDEAQDLLAEELEGVLCLADKVCICGDTQQGIYHKDGMSVGQRLGLTSYRLKTHYRIGQEIARVADRILPQAEGHPSLAASSNYNASVQGESSATLHKCADRAAQFDEMFQRIEVQLKAFPGDWIGILCAKRDTTQEVYERFKGTSLESKVHIYGGSEGGLGPGPIQIMTMHSSKGLEFRAAHLFGIEEMRHGPLSNPTLAYTAVTRAKTTLHAYSTGRTSAEVEGAFAPPSLVDIKDIFPGA